MYVSLQTKTISFLGMANCNSQWQPESRDRMVESDIADKHYVDPIILGMIPQNVVFLKSF